MTLNRYYIRIPERTLDRPREVTLEEESSCAQWARSSSRKLLSLSDIILRVQLSASAIREWRTEECISEDSIIVGNEAYQFEIPNIEEQNEKNEKETQTKRKKLDKNVVEREIE